MSDTKLKYDPIVTRDSLGSITRIAFEMEWGVFHSGEVLTCSWFSKHDPGELIKSKSWQPICEDERRTTPYVVLVSDPDSATIKITYNPGSGVHVLTQ